MGLLPGGVSVVSRTLVLVLGVGPGGLGKVMAVAADEARSAIYAEIKRQVAAVEGSGWAEKDQAVVIRDLALAFRYTYGGQQPGGVVLEK